MFHFCYSRTQRFETVSLLLISLHRENSSTKFNFSILSLCFRYFVVTYFLAKPSGMQIENSFHAIKSRLVEFSRYKNQFNQSTLTRGKLHFNLWVNWKHRSWLIVMPLYVLVYATIRVKIDGRVVTFLYIRKAIGLSIVISSVLL